MGYRCTKPKRRIKGSWCRHTCTGSLIFSMLAPPKRGNRDQLWKPRPGLVPHRPRDVPEFGVPFSTLSTAPIYDDKFILKLFIFSWSHRPNRVPTWPHTGPAKFRNPEQHRCTETEGYWLSILAMHQKLIRTFFRIPKELFEFWKMWSLGVCFQRAVFCSNRFWDSLKV